MKLEARILQKQTATLKMTQELKQAITLLQYSSQELTTFLENKALENPLLQIDSDFFHSRDHIIKPQKTNVENRSDHQKWIEQFSTETKQLDTYIFSQLNIHQSQPLSRKILNEIIHNIDENGYFRGDLDEVATLFKVSKENVNYYLKMIQELEPAGIGARSLQECLYLQLKRLRQRNELAEVIISEHFYLFAEKQWKELASILKVNIVRIQDVFDLVQTLNPRPASDFHHDKPIYVVPDVMIIQNGDIFSINLVDEAIPKISFNNDYYAQFSTKKENVVSQFLRDKRQEYKWLLKSIDQRKQTILKVTMKIVEKQLDFFIGGPSHLKQLTLKDISDELEVHESTVSRTVRSKYVQTPYGIYELKSFFTSTIQTTSNENISSNLVKKTILNLITNEDKEKPLSDQEIVGLLKNNNDIVVSRRTIAKYRDQLGIHSSTKRKRYK